MKIKTFGKFKREIEDIQSGNLWMTLQVIALMTGILTVLELTVFPSIPLLSVIIPLTCFLTVLGMIIFHFFKNMCKKLSVILCLYLGLIFSPSFIYCAHTASNNAPLFVILTFIAISFLLDIREYWPIYILVGYVNLFVFIKFFLWQDISPLDHDPLIYFMGFAVMFLVVAIALFSSALMQERTFYTIKERIEESRNKERAAALAKARFLANMSNEIRSPMNSIIGLSELVLKEELNDEARNHVNALKQSSYDLLEIIDDVLAYSKLEAHKVVLHNEDFYFEELLKRVLNSISDQTIEKNLKVETVVDHNIPRCMYGDVTLIRQVFLRLIFISILLTENGRIMLSVECTRDEEDKTAHLLCKIKDTGCGLSVADINAIEGAYTTYDSRQNSNLKGLGLKFNICEEIMKLMNGNLSVRSISGVGLESRFEFDCEIRNPEPMIRVDGGYNKNILVYVNDSRELESWQAVMEGFNLRPDYVNSYYSFEKALQIKKYDYIFLLSSMYVSVANVIAAFHCEEETYVVANANQAYGDFDKCRIIRHPVSCLSIAKIVNNEWKAEDYTIRNDDVHYDCSKAKILVVDDNSVNLKVAAGVFKVYKIDIDIAKSGHEAIEKATRTNYDIIFMDMVMPELSGDETLKRMRKSNVPSLTNVPVVALTATTGSTVREEILSLGFQEYLGKPMKKQYLLQILLAFLPPELIKVVEGPGKEKAAAPKTENVSNNELSVNDSVLDVKKGVASVGGNENVYRNILNTYYKESLEKIELIRNSLQVKDIATFTVYVHAVKSASASIGADVVSAMFKDLEAAGKSNNLTFIESHVENYLHALKDMTEKVKIYLVANNCFEQK